jgi:putative tricarboxylic transport membrane protein
MDQVAEPRQAGPATGAATSGRARFLRAVLSPIGIGLFALWASWTYDASSSPFLWMIGWGIALIALGLAVLSSRVSARNPQDYYGGLAMIAVALFAFWAGSDLSGLRGFSFGPGTAPRLFGGVLMVLAGLVTINGLVDGPPLERYAVRAPVLVTLSILSFAAFIRPLGLVISTFLTFVIAASASTETRWREAIIAAVAMTAFCVGIFVYLLKLPFLLWPIGL